MDIQIFNLNIVITTKPSIKKEMRKLTILHGKIAAIRYCKNALDCSLSKACEMWQEYCGDLPPYPTMEAHDGKR